MSKNKYLRKNEFRYNTNPAVKNPRGQGHMAYVSVRQGHKAKINIITHARTFYGEPTMKLRENPNRSKPSKRPSRFSVPRWEKDKYVTEKPNDTWRLSKVDRSAIRKFNVKYDQKNRKK